MATCLIALGSNLGDRVALLTDAIARLVAQSEIRVLARSRWYQTAPVGGPVGQDEFVNAAVRVETTLAPSALLAVLRDVEQQLGRERHERWGARRVDLDLLLYDDLVLHTPDLTLPHPRMAFRRFVLEPAADVAPDLMHPLLGWTVQRLLEHLQTAVNYVALTGVPATGKTAAAEQLAAGSAVGLIRDPDIPTPARGMNDAADAAAPGASEAARLAERARLLDATAWPTAQAPAVSDFWLGQAWAYVQCGLTAAAEGTWATLYQQAAERVVPPKLLVLLDAAPSPDAAREALRTRLRQCVQDWRQGPTLILDATQPATVLVELAAAVLALQ